MNQASDKLAVVFAQAVLSAQDMDVGSPDRYWILAIKRPAIVCEIQGNMIFSVWTEDVFAQFAIIGNSGFPLIDSVQRADAAIMALCSQEGQIGKQKGDDKTVQPGHC